MLNRCPFCNGIADLVDARRASSPDDMYIACGDCFARGPRVGDKKGASMAWNAWGVVCERKESDR
jgi:hypothetical protein